MRLRYRPYADHVTDVIVLGLIAVFVYLVCGIPQ